jgi:hypothetical protein
MKTQICQCWVLPVDAMANPDRSGTADVTGYGPVPERIAHDVLGDTGGGRWWRRLFTTPAGLVGPTPADARSTAPWPT